VTVLVTGGAGFIGSHLCNALVADGESVRALDNLDPLAHAQADRPARLSQDVDFVVGDLRNADAIVSALEGVDRVYHLGGVVGNGESMINVARAVETNSLGTANLIEAILERRDRVRKLVVASSMVVYGEGAYVCAAHGRIAGPARNAERLARREWDPCCPACKEPMEPVPIRESDPLRPLSVYGITKRDQEELCLTVGGAYGLDVAALRYLNVYGPGQALANPYTGVAAIFAARVINGRAPLVFEDGRQLRDLVHVSDIVRATRLAMDSPAAAGHAINVASRGAIRIGELADRIVELLGGDQQPSVTGEHRVGDIRHCLGDATLARELLGFEARVAVEHGLPELAEWVSRQLVEERGDAALTQLREVGLVQ